MQKLMLLIGAILMFCLSLKGQDAILLKADTIIIDEVLVIQSVPLNNNDRLNHYQVSKVSGIDKINSRLANVSVISRGAFAMEPAINSFSAGQINVTIDGMKMFGACTDKMDPITSYVEPTNLKSIELSQGSTGSMNGSTVGGSFNMQLEKPKTNIFSANAGFNYETAHHGKMAYVNLNYGKSKWAYRLSANFRKYEEYSDGNDSIVPFTQFAKYNIHQSLLLVPKNQHNITLTWLSDVAQDVGYTALPMDVGKAIANIYSIDYKADSTVFGIGQFKAKVYANTIYHLMDDSMRDSLYMVNNSRTGGLDSVYMVMDMPGWSNTYGGFIQGNIVSKDKYTLFFKIEDYYNWSMAEMTMYMNNLTYPGEPSMYVETWPENGRNVAGIYLKNSFQISSKLKLVGDFRLDYSSSSILSEQGANQFNILGYNADNAYAEIVKSVNINATYKWFSQFKINGGLGYGERLPSLSEQFGFYLFNAKDGYDYIGNPDIGIEKSLNIWTKFSYSAPKFKYVLDLSTNNLKNYIFGLYKPEYNSLNLYATGVKQYVNMDKAKLFAFNCQLLYKPIQSIELFGILKYNYGSLQNNDPLPLIQPLKTIVSATYKKANYFFQFEIESSAKQARINANFGEGLTDGFTLLNFRSGYDIKWSKSMLGLNFGIDNIMNKIYSEHLDWGNYYRPGRNFYFGLSYRY